MDEKEFAKKVLLDFEKMKKQFQKDFGLDDFWYDETRAGTWMKGFKAGFEMIAKVELKKEGEK